MTLKTRLRRTDPTGAEPQPPMTLPDGHWIGFDYPGRIAPLTRRELRPWHRLFLAGIRLGAKDTYDYTCFLVTARLGRVFPLTRCSSPNYSSTGVSRRPTASGSSSASRGGWGASTNLRTTPGWRSSSACRAPRSRP
jgi:hypothetical protein